jgi:purine-binding chemotaxis protein CheW
MDDAPAEALGQYLTFDAAGQQLGVAILAVKEIIEAGRITRVPLVPPYIRGVINLRGSVLPVVDLSARLGGAPAQITKRSCIVLVEIREAEGRHLLGMLVDGVNEIVEIAPGDVQQPPAFGTDIRADFIQAMGRVGDAFMVLLAVDRVLSMEELSLLEGVRAQAQASVAAGAPAGEPPAAVPKAGAQS